MFNVFVEQNGNEHLIKNIKFSKQKKLKQQLLLI